MAEGTKLDNPHSMIRSSIIQSFRYELQTPHPIWNNSIPIPFVIFDIQSASFEGSCKEQGFSQRFTTTQQSCHLSIMGFRSILQQYKNILRFNA